MVTGGGAKLKAHLENIKNRLGSGPLELGRGEVLR